ncbi:HAD family hydrolase [Rhodosalinus halophilus]|uniref:phosphoglycolate phosphatase n=1 Tax=Rhodosalinus halophilus TaxID=2259333 RepID=A0A365UBD2_9RHOB|nr:HAD family hydrolase [Rhodosalinus halophilus]RBI86556.1 HAD family hydrolase [Rhodosalinus halophilus]
MSARRAGAVLFDKDGTLFGFHATWSAFAAEVIEELAAGDAALAQSVARALGFDLAERRFHRDSPVIAGTNREVAELVATVLPGAEAVALEPWLAARAAEAPLAPAVPLAPLMERLREMGLRLGVMTNDSELAARAHLLAAEIEAAFDWMAGADSGHGAKPDPAPLLAFARAVALEPAQVVMVGDSLHDLHAGRAAGMQVVGVLTGPAEANDLAPHADAVLPDIGHLPAWLTRG